MSETQSLFGVKRQFYKFLDKMGEQKSLKYITKVGIKYMMRFWILDLNASHLLTSFLKERISLAITCPSRKIIWEVGLITQEKDFPPILLISITLGNSIFH